MTYTMHFEGNFPKHERTLNETKHISITSSLIRLQALVSLTRIEAKHTKLTSLLPLFIH